MRNIESSNGCVKKHYQYKYGNWYYENGFYFVSLFSLKQEKLDNFDECTHKLQEL